MLLPMYAFNKKIKANRKIGHGLLLFVLLFSMYIKPINMLWHGGQDPELAPLQIFLHSLVYHGFHGGGGILKA